MPTPTPSTVSHAATPSPRRPFGRTVLVLAWLLALLAPAGLAHAQDAFVGGGVALEDVVMPTLSVQAGGLVAPHVALRASLDALAFVINFVDAAGDVLYTTAPDPGTVWYAGAGPDLYFASITNVGSGLVAGFHLTGGVELPVNPSTGIYIELRPGMPVTFTGVLVGIRLGVNAHF